MIKIKKLNKKILAVTLIILIVIAGLLTFYLKDRFDKSPQTENVSTNQEPINFDPPTDEDAKRVDENKQEIVNREDKLKNQPNNSSTIKPTITYADQNRNNVEVGAYVNVFEEGGTCTATFSRGNINITKSVQAIRNVNSVDCPMMSVATSELSQKGTYTVTVSYSSTAHNGVSDPRQVEVK